MYGAQHFSTEEFRDWSDDMIWTTALPYFPEHELACKGSWVNVQSAGLSGV